MGQPARDRSHRGGSAPVATVYGRPRPRDLDDEPPPRERRRDGRPSNRPGKKSRNGKKKVSFFQRIAAVHPRWALVLAVLGSIVVLVAGGGYLIVKIGLNTVGGAVNQTNLLGGGAAAAPAGQSINGALNILLAGVDMTGVGDQGSHSDTIIIMHIPATHDRAYLVSIPRDTSVDIPADSKTGFGGGSYKVNAAFTFGSQNGGGDAGGFQLLANTLNQEYGLTFNAGAIVNFDGFEDIVKQLGGVDLYIDETVYSIHRGTNIATGKPAAPYHIDPNTGVPICANPNITFDSDPLGCAIAGVKPYVYEKGQRHLDPASALDFVRARDGLDGTDYARQRHQLQFIKAVVQEAYSKGLSDPLKLGSFMSSIAKAFVFDGNGTAIGDWIFTLKGIKPSSMVTIKMNGGQFVTYTGPAPDSRQALNQTSLDLLNAIKTDTDPNVDKVGTFISQYPSWIAS